MSIRSISVSALFLSLLACSTSERDDSAKAAQTKNEENFATRDGEKDADFVVRAVENSYAEIRLAQLAVGKSGDAGVKQIAVMLEKDHDKVLNELKDLAYKKGIAIPVEENRDAKDEVRDLSKEETGAFNKDWLKNLAERHEHLVKEYETTWDKTQDAELKSWINNALPEIRVHLDRVRTYESRPK